MNRVCVARVFLSKMCFTYTKDTFQWNTIAIVQTGDNVTLTCTPPSNDFRSVTWFRQIAGKTLQFIVAAYRDTAASPAYDEFKDKHRFTLRNEEDMFNLHIAKTELSDVAIYYCAVFCYVLDMKFQGGIVLILKGLKSKSRTVVQQPVSDPVQPGDSVTLQCKIDTEICAGEHSVYWFRHGTGESLPGIIYTHGNRSDQCEKCPVAGSPTQSCVYNLPKRNLSLSDAGTYYCAVATCGEILFGNGTTLDIECTGKDMDALILGLGVLLVLIVVVNIVLISIMRNKKECCKHCTVYASKAKLSQQVIPDASMAEQWIFQNRDEEKLNYATGRQEGQLIVLAVADHSSSTTQHHWTELVVIAGILNA